MLPIQDLKKSSEIYDPFNNIYLTTALVTNVPLFGLREHLKHVRIIGTQTEKSKNKQNQ